MQWHNDLDKEIIGEEWDKIWDQRIMKNMSVRIKENFYKVIWRWYLPPVKMNIMDKSVSTLCWSLKKRRGRIYICGGYAKEERMEFNI